MKKIKVAINGFGRIGRAFFRIAKNVPEIEIVAINDIGDIDTIAYLLRYDSVYGKLNEEVSVDKDNMILHVGDREIIFLNERDPQNLSWKEHNIDIVVESTGIFSDYEKSNAHRDAGAKRVVITAPVKTDAPYGISGATVLMGVNEEQLSLCDISSNASCTTNAASPLMQIMTETLGVEKALLNTIHGYTATQSLVDSPSKKDVRRGRAAAQNIIPSTTGAAEAVTKAVKDLPFFDGIAVRVPVISGSYADMTFIAKRDTTRDEINNILKNAAQEERWNGIFTITEEPLVSSDIVGDLHAAIADLSFTRVVGGNLVKLLSWYDNEAGYANTLVKHVIESGKYVI